MDRDDNKGKYSLIIASDVSLESLIKVYNEASSTTRSEFLPKMSAEQFETVIDACNLFR